MIVTSAPQFTSQTKSAPSILIAVISCPSVFFPGSSPNSSPIVTRADGAKATIVNSLSEEAGVTRVDVVTDFTITGKLARHNGVDIPAPYGTPIYATADGIVGRAQRLGGYGNYVEVEHGNAIQTRYGHMSSYIVAPGQQVKKGDILGYVGSTGRSTGNHLHYEVRIEGEPVNPMPFCQSETMAIAAITGNKKLAMGGPE